MPKLTDITKELVRTGLRIYNESTDEGKKRIADNATYILFYWCIPVPVFLQIREDKARACQIFLWLIKDNRWRMLPEFRDKFAWELPWNADNKEDAVNYVTKKGTKISANDGILDTVAYGQLQDQIYKSYNATDI